MTDYMTCSNESLSDLLERAKDHMSSRTFQAIKLEMDDAIRQRPKNTCTTYQNIEVFCMNVLGEEW